MDIDSNYLEIKEYIDTGYSPVVDFQEWRVAVLNYCDELRVENIKTMQRHDETDEVFVLLKGDFILYVASGNKQLEEVYAIKLEPFKLYNVKKGTWHTHTLSPDASVLIIENKDTHSENSPLIDIGKEAKQEMVRCCTQMMNC